MDEYTEEKIIEERKKKVLGFIKNNPQLIFYFVLVLLVILGIYIRYLPLTDHNPNVAGVQPGLWDYTTNDYTLGPDLDPFLFLRYAKTIIENGSLSRIDNMRYVPLGFDTTTELQMVSYSIVLTYRLVNLFGNYSINFAGAFMPVLAFALTIIAFFFFVREIFLRKNEKETYIKSSIIASIATLFMIIIPAFLSRTVAGIPEKESVAFFFMFLAFFLFLKAWKAEKIISASIFGVLAGISTGLMGLSWGGVTYVYIAIGLAGMIGFILNKFGLKQTFAYGLWLFSSMILTLMFTRRAGVGQFLFGTDTGIALLAFLLIIAYYILWKTKLNKIFGLEKIKIPRTIITFIILAILGVIFILVINPRVITEKMGQISGILIKPVTGRWSLTVAENAQPYFTSWYGSFGKTIFWLFFIGSVILFYKMLNTLKRKEFLTLTTAIILTALYILFFFGLVFSRYAPHPALFDGENFISKLFFYGSTVILACGFIYYYIKYHKENDSGFERIEIEYVLLFALFVLTLFTARSAVRLIMVLVPIAPIFLSYLIVESGYVSRKANNKNLKNMLIICCILLGLVAFIFAFVNFNNHTGYFKQIKSQAYGFIPYTYTYQWQSAMAWVRNNTSPDAVFAHWWDYGYWVQSIGNRATVTDGGNAIVWWNYLTGRLVLTGDNQKDSLNFLWNHNATHLLIDSTDIVKYGAFSQIGSDKNYDRFSFGPLTFLSNQKDSQEKANGTLRIYQGGYCADEDINYNLDGKNVFLPGIQKDDSGNSACYSQIAGILLEYNENSGQLHIKQPEAVFIYNNMQIKIPLRYLYYNNQLYDFKKGLNAAFYPIPRVASNNVDNVGAGIYLSPKILKGFLGQVYILNDALGNFPNFKLKHSEPDIFQQSINSQGIKLGEFNYFDNYGGLQGPIKILAIEYTGKEEVKEDYLVKIPPSYITWNF